MGDPSSQSSQDLKAHFQQKIKPILDVFNKVSQLLKSESIELPRIAVIGDQSSGKSSVLESISQVTFPRGENIVTRCPIQLQMRENEVVRGKVKWEKDETIFEKEFNDLAETEQTIREATEQLLELEDYEVSTTVIYVDIQSPDSPNLTLVDLPGLTYKNEHVTPQIKQMYHEYIKQQATIILIILAAANDFEATEAVQLAKNVDPERKRTIPVITKIDQNSQGIAKKIEANELGFKLGYYLVRNRTQEELANKISFEELLQKERQCLANIEFESIKKESKGIQNLIRQLANLQSRKAEEEVHRVRQEIKNLKIEVDNKLNNLPRSCHDLTEKEQEFQYMLKQLCKTYKRLSNANYTYINQSILNRNEKENYFCKDVKDLFDKHQEVLKNNSEPYLSNESHIKLEEQIKLQYNFQQLSNFLDAKFFRDEMRKEVQKARNPTIQLIFDVFSYIKETLSAIANDYFKEFPDLLEQVKLTIQDFLRQIQQQANIYCQELIDKEFHLAGFTKNILYEIAFQRLIQRFVYKDYSILNTNKNSQAKAQFFDNYNTEDQLRRCTYNVSDLETLQYNINQLENLNGNEKVNNYQSLDSEKKKVVQLQFSLIAYNVVYQTRFIECCHQHLCYIIKQKIISQLEELLNKKFSPTMSKNQHAKSYLSRPDIEQEYINLQNRKNKLDKALKSFQRILQD